MKKAHYQILILYIGFIGKYIHCTLVFDERQYFKSIILYPHSEFNFGM
jgi:hypothetical protein